MQRSRVPVGFLSFLFSIPRTLVAPTSAPSSDFIQQGLCTCDLRDLSLNSLLPWWKTDIDSLSKEYLGSSLSSPVAFRQQPAWEVPALFGFPPAQPHLSLRSSLRPLHVRWRDLRVPSPAAYCLCYSLALCKAQNAETFLFILILHTQTTAKSVCVLLIGCTSQFSFPHPSLP